MFWERMPDLCKRSLSDDVRDIEVLGEMSLSFPLLHFVGSSANELRTILSGDMVDNILTSNLTSAPPTSLT